LPFRAGKILDGRETASRLEVNRTIMKRNLVQLREEPFDLLIIGGGITGAGVCLDASLRGYRVALIDKGDFASGTSSVSSKLIHGGLRYLEHGSFHLVYEALHERRLLLTNAPHLVHPLRFTIPFYLGSRVPAWKWRAGLTLYDILAGRSNLGRSHSLNASRLKAEFPRLRETGLHGGAAYCDAQTDDARLCLEVLKTSARQGACLANYVEAVGFERDSRQITGVKVVDKIKDYAFTIRARLVLNASGPWVDQVCRLAGDSGGPYLQPTKGVHLIVPDQGMGSAFLLLHPDDGRAFFVLPWNGRTLIGTTDTLCEQSPDNLKVTEAEVAYLLAGFNHYFTPALQGDDVVNTIVGVRPLLRAKTNDPSSLSREFRVWTSNSGLISVAGGKYTTYRAMAEAVTDSVAHRLGKRRRCETRQFKLDGTPAEPWLEFKAAETRRICLEFGLDPKAASHLVGRYGQRARVVAGYVKYDPLLAHPITPEEPDLRAELVYQQDQEMAVRPGDFLLRRTKLGLFHPRLMDSKSDASLPRKRGEVGCELPPLTREAR
jgi:glycerol-3-phosphate dehydrogenase